MSKHASKPPARPRALTSITSIAKEAAMTTLAVRSSLDELYGFIAKVSGYPISVRQLLKLARDSQVPKEVIKFYEAFDADQVFKDKDDLISRSEQVEIMREERGEMPKEEERSPEEY